MRYIIGFVLFWITSIQPAAADRIKDLTSIATVRANQLVGYGLVVGLSGTGDGSDLTFTGQSLRAMLNQLGVSVDGALSDFDAGVKAKDSVDIKNTAAVIPDQKE